MFSDEMLTIEDLAAYLKLKPQTIYKWAQTGKIPGAKFGKEWRFRRSSIEKWIDIHMPVLSETGSDPAGARKQAENAVAGETEHVEPAQEPARSSQETRHSRDQARGHAEKGGRQAGTEKPEVWAPVRSEAQPLRLSSAPENSAPDGFGSDGSQRAGIQRGVGVPAEKLASSKKGSRSARKDRGPDSN